MKVSDASGSLAFTQVRTRFTTRIFAENSNPSQVAAGPDINKSLLTSDDVFILDNGEEIFAWIGNHSLLLQRSKNISLIMYRKERF
jgi:hypothetical protein